jgi:hypothetical protein
LAAVTWFKTDELEFVQNVKGNVFQVLEIVNVKSNFLLQETLINLDSYTDDEINEYLDDYFPSLVQIKELYRDNWKAILAAIIACVQLPQER